MSGQKRYSNFVNLHKRTGEGFAVEMNEKYYAELSKEISSVKISIAELKKDFKSLELRIDEVVISQLKDHGKRIAILEAAENKRLGAIAIISTLFGVFGACIIRLFFYGN